MKFTQLDASYKKELLALWKIAFDEDEDFDDDICHAFFSHPDLWKHTYGMSDNGKLVSTYMSIPVMILIREKKFEATYIDGLATLPEYRRRGLIHQQMLDDAKRCIHNNISLMLVDPSRDSFYRKFGFEYAFDKFRISFDNTFLKDNTATSSTIKSSKLSDSSIQDDYKVINKWLYDNSRYNELIWAPCYEDIKFKRDDISISLAYDKDSMPSGYMLYTIEDDNMIIESFKFTSLDAFFALKSYMSQNNKIKQYVFKSIPQNFPLHLLVKDISRPEKRLLLTSCMTRMMRITNLEKVLERLIHNCPKAPICIYIWDDIITENSGYYTISIDRKVTKSYIGNMDCKINITDIVPLLSGLKSAKELYYSDMLKVNVMDVSQSRDSLPNVISELDTILSKTVTFSADEYLAP